MDPNGHELPLPVLALDVIIQRGKKASVASPNSFGDGRNKMRILPSLVGTPTKNK